MTKIGGFQPTYQPQTRGNVQQSGETGQSFRITPADFGTKLNHADVTLTPEDRKQLFEKGYLDVQHRMTVQESPEGIFSIAGKAVACIFGPSKSLAQIKIDPKFIEMLKDPECRLGFGMTRTFQHSLMIAPPTDSPPVKKDEMMEWPPTVKKTTTFVPGTDIMRKTTPEQTRKEPEPNTLPGGSSVPTDDLGVYYFDASTQAYKPGDVHRMKNAVQEGETVEALGGSTISNQISPKEREVANFAIYAAHSGDYASITSFSNANIKHSASNDAQLFAIYGDSKQGDKFNADHNLTALTHWQEPLSANPPAADRYAQAKKNEFMQQSGLPATDPKVKEAYDKALAEAQNPNRQPPLTLEDAFLARNKTMMLGGEPTSVDGRPLPPNEAAAAKKEQAKLGAEYAAMYKELTGKDLSPEQLAKVSLNDYFVLRYAQASNQPREAVINNAAAVAFAKYPNKPLSEHKKEIRATLDERMPPIDPKKLTFDENGKPTGFTDPSGKSVSLDAPGGKFTYQRCITNFTSQVETNRGGKLVLSGNGAGTSGDAAVVNFKVQQLLGSDPKYGVKEQNFGNLKDDTEMFGTDGHIQTTDDARYYGQAGTRGVSNTSGNAQVVDNIVDDTGEQNLALAGHTFKAHGTPSGSTIPPKPEDIGQFAGTMYKNIETMRTTSKANGTMDPSQGAPCDFVKFKNDYLDDIKGLQDMQAKYGDVDVTINGETKKLSVVIADLEAKYKESYDFVMTSPEYKDPVVSAGSDVFTENLKTLESKGTAPAVYKGQAQDTDYQMDGKTVKLPKQLAEFLTGMDADLKAMEGKPGYEKAKADYDKAREAAINMCQQGYKLQTAQTLASGGEQFATDVGKSITAFRAPLEKVVAKGAPVSEADKTAMKKFVTETQANVLDYMNGSLGTQEFKSVGDLTPEKIGVAATAAAKAQGLTEPAFSKYIADAQAVGAKLLTQMTDLQVMTNTVPDAAFVADSKKLLGDLKVATANPQTFIDNAVKKGVVTKMQELAGPNKPMAELTGDDKIKAEKFTETMAKNFFGKEVKDMSKEDLAKIEALRLKCASGNLPLPPNIKFGDAEMFKSAKRDDGQTGTINAAFTGSGKDATIYLNPDLMNKDPKVVQKVILEEVFHYMETEGQDLASKSGPSVTDKGEKLAAAMYGDDPSKVGDDKDSGTMTIGGQSVKVRFSSEEVTVGGDLSKLTDEQLKAKSEQTVPEGADHDKVQADVDAAKKEMLIREYAGASTAALKTATKQKEESTDGLEGDALTAAQDKNKQIKMQNEVATAELAKRTELNSKNDEELAALAGGTGPDASRAKAMQNDRRMLTYKADYKHGDINKLEEQESYLTNASKADPSNQVLKDKLAALKEVKAEMFPRVENKYEVKPSAGDYWSMGIDMLAKFLENLDEALNSLADKLEDIGNKMYMGKETALGLSTRGISDTAKSTMRNVSDGKSAPTTTMDRSIGSIERERQDREYRAQMSKEVST